MRNKTDFVQLVPTELFFRPRSCMILQSFSKIIWTTALQCFRNSPFAYPCLQDTPFICIKSKSVADFSLFVVHNQVLICADRLPQQHLLILLRDRICVTDARLHIEHSTNAHQRCTTGNDKNCTAKNLQQFFHKTFLSFEYL